MEDAGSVIASSGVLILLLVLGLAWLFMPFLLLSKMGEQLKVQKQIVAELQKANAWHGRHEYFLANPGAAKEAQDYANG